VTAADTAGAKAPPAEPDQAGEGAPGAGRSSLADVCAVLWPPPATASLSRGPRPLRGREPDRERGRGRERDFVVLPSARRPRLLVPSGRRVSAAAVRRYGEPGSVPAWAASRALALALAAGGASVGLGGRLRVTAAPGTAEPGTAEPGTAEPGTAEPGTGTIEAYLRSVLGYQVLISTHLGAARANRKPVLQLLTPRGETVGFAKISVNPLTRELIRAERAALDTLAAGSLQALSVPRVLHHGRWQGREVLIMTALPVWRRRKALRPGQLTAAMSELAAVGGRSRGPLAGCDYLDRLRSRLADAPPGPDRATLGDALDALTAAGPELSFGAWHGDWTGWNMASTAGGLLVWDWERFAPGVPVGFDPLHYRLQSDVVRGRRPPAEAAGACVQDAAACLAPFGVPAGEARLVAVLYLAELSARYLADRQAEAGARLGRPGTWLIPAIEEAVKTL
jgi:hypothetical protein